MKTQLLGNLPVNPRVRTTALNGSPQNVQHVAIHAPALFQRFWVDSARRKTLSENYVSHFLQRNKSFCKLRR